MSLYTKIKAVIRRSGTIRKRIAFSYLAVIIVGTLFFMSGLTMNDGKAISLIDAFFTATSAFANSGLNVVDIHGFNAFGHFVTIILLEFGGFGVMAFKIFVFLFLGQKVNVSDRLFISTEQHQNTPSGIIKLMKVSGVIFFSSQIILALFFAGRFILTYDYSLLDALGYGIYHSVNTINSAGYDIFPGGLASFRTDYIIQIVTMIGLFIGGIGFPSLYEMYVARKHRKQNKYFRYSLYFRVNMATYFTVLVVGLVLLLISESNGVLANYPNGEGFFYILFQSFSLRSAGFLTLGLDNFSSASHFIFMILMFIGVGPASTGGGIRTTTVGIIFVYFIAFIRGRERVEVSNRTLTKQSIISAFFVLSTAVLFVVIATLSIMMQSKDVSFLNAVFEAISAFGTIGTSLDVTEKLNLFNKIIISVLMIIGRLGIIGALMLFSSKNNTSNKIKTPEENIAVG